MESIIYWAWYLKIDTLSKTMPSTTEAKVTAKKAIITKYRVIFNNCEL